MSNDFKCLRNYLNYKRIVYIQIRKHLIKITNYKCLQKLDYVVGFYNIEYLEKYI